MVRINAGTDYFEMPIGSAVALDSSAGARLAGSDDRVVGVATHLEGGAVQVAVDGVVSLTEAQWTAVAGAPLVPGAAYWSTAEGRLTRERPQGQATQVGVAITATDLRVEILPTPPTKKPEWQDRLPDAARVELAALSGAAHAAARAASKELRS